MSIVWELRLYDSNGARVATFDQWPELVVELGVNRPAVYALRFDGSDPRVGLFEQDALLEGWWTNAERGIEWRREFVAWCIDTRKWTDGGGVKRFVSSGLGLEDLLARTIIDTYSGSPESRKSGAGETVLKSFVNEQAGPGAIARARTGLTIEADSARGAAWSGQRSNRSLLSVCQQIAELTGLQFGIVRTGAYDFEFRVWEPVDRRATVIFAEDRGNMGEPEVIEHQSEVANWVKVGGDDAGDAREFEYVEDAASVALSPQNRRERFVNAVDQEPGAELETRGLQEIDKNRALVEFNFKVLQSPGCLYGLHYELGDYVTAIYDGVAYDRRIDAARWRVSADGAELEIATVAA
jgi:hypothetical protein